MSLAFVSEPLFPLEGSFDALRMSCGEPGLPRRFRWRDEEFEVAEVLETWKEHGDCRHGSGERYLRRHGYRLRTTGGIVLKVYFQRSFGRAKNRGPSRWWVQSVETSSRPAREKFSLRGIASQVSSP